MLINGANPITFKNIDIHFNIEVEIKEIYFNCSQIIGIALQKYKLYIKINKIIVRMKFENIFLSLGVL